MLQTNRWPLGVLSQETTGLMTREQVADFVLFELKAYESRGLIAPPSMQTVADQEKREAMFCHIKSWWDYSSGIFFQVIWRVSVWRYFRQSGAPFAKDFVGYKPNGPSNQWVLPSLTWWWGFMTRDKWRFRTEHRKFAQRASMFQEANCSNQAIADCQVRMQKHFWEKCPLSLPNFHCNIGRPRWKEWTNTQRKAKSRLTKRWTTARHQTNRQ